MLAIILAVTMRSIKLRAALVTGLAASVALIWCSEPLFSGMYERMLLKEDYTPGFTFLRQIENRSGVIAVTKDGTVFGGGVYDGRFSTDPVNDTNGIVRAYAIASFHPDPKRVLMVGLSSGSWAQVIANNPQVEKLTIIEINPGYLQLIPTIPTVASLLHNPKVEIIIDDGRRWLIHNPAKRFDLVVSNTSFHWRAHISNLLSIEFLRLIRSHLNPGGIHFYNTTFSKEVLLTGATEFPHSLRVGSFLAVSDDPILVDKRRWATALNNYRIDGKPIFDSKDPLQRRSIDQILSLADTIGDPDGSVKLRLEPGDNLRKRLKNNRLVTDDNMGTEWL